MTVTPSRPGTSCMRVELLDPAGPGSAGAVHCGALLWRAGPQWRMVASSVLGGGLGERAWVLNVQVPGGYARMDPEDHLRSVARAAGVAGPGVGLMTAAEVALYGQAEGEGITAVATAGVGVTTWAAAPAAGLPGVPPPGTINIVAAVPAPLTDAALVNAVATATEAKVQALLEAGHDCSGTPTDAVCVAARTPRPGADAAGFPDAESFAGPRSVWGSRLARAVHAAVLRSLAAAPVPGAQGAGSP